MLLMRACFSLLILTFAVNKDLKKVTWDPVDRKSVGPLAFRSAQGSITNIINYSVTKYLPLTLISIVNNLSPLVTVILAFFILKERIKKFEIFILIITMGGVALVVIGGNGKQTDQGDASMAFIYMLYGALFINPFLTSGGNIAMRQMKKFHWSIVSWYLNWAMATTSLIMILALG
mmetsp:Transcript_31552/g.41786  ORF Transcript_31552/g.41786 Transcript_31552/m.41786 type:complete len:176 (+) Transcript_31552:678-1205(+)